MIDPPGTLGVASLPGGSRLGYTGLILLVAAARLAELRRSRRNAERLRARGGLESGAGHYPVMVAIHAACLVACVAEVWLLRRALVPGLAAVMLALVGATFALRYWAIASLGEYWSTRVIVVPRAPRVRAGPYRFLRHPNYLAVLVELPALALVHGAWLSAAVFGLANAGVLAYRIRVEDHALGVGGAPCEE